VLQVNEKSTGKEKIDIKLDKLAANTPPSFFGNPVTGTTAYAACIYDEEDDLVATLRVNRAQGTCGTKPCWKELGGAGGFKYNDKELTADGVLKILLKAGDAGKGKAQVKGKRNAPKGQTALPIGVAAQLAGDTSATVQLHSSNAGCITGDITNVKDNTSILFKGQTP
jgi:hypothetical protein